MNALPAERLRSPTSSRDEMNLAEFPLAVLSTRAKGDIKTLEFKDHHRTKGGELVERQWIITGADKFGLPTSTDDDVVLGLIALTMEDGFHNRKVFFTRYELLRILRWTSEGRSYQRLTKSLDRLSGVRIRASNAFFDNTAKAYQTLNFGIIDAYELNDERAAKKRVEASKSYFVWSEVIFESFKAGFIKKLDLNIYFSLESAVSRRLYRYLDKHFYYRSVVERSLMAFAFEKIGLSRTYRYVSSVKQQLEPAAEELVRIGFLGGFEYSGKGEGTVVRFLAAGAPSEAGYRSTPERPQPSPELVKELEVRGLSAGQAAKLVGGASEQTHPRLREILRYYDFLVQSNDARVSKNPVGFLYRAMENPHRFTVPAQFRGREGQGPPGRPNRPELRVVRPSASVPGGENEAYRAYAEREVANYRAKLGAEEIAEIYRQIVAKVGCLKPVLEAGRFREAVEGCVFDELKRQAGVADLPIWMREGRTGSSA